MGDREVREEEEHQMEHELLEALRTLQQVLLFSAEELQEASHRVLLTRA